MTRKYYTCSSCHEPTALSTAATDRVGLERDRGESFVATCAHCHKPRSVHVNEVKAQPNPLVTGIAVAAAVTATLALLHIGLLAYVSLAFPVIVYGVQTKEAETFNAYLLPRR